MHNAREKAFKEIDKIAGSSKRKTTEEEYEKARKEASKELEIKFDL